MARETPAHWADIMQRRGIPSIRALSDRAGLTHPTVLSVIHGSAKRPQTETLVKLARALDIPLRDIYWLIGHENPTAEEWEPPADANLMSPEQREVVETLIRMLANPAREQERVDREAALEKYRREHDGGNVRRLRPVDPEHPEAPGKNYAADTSHGPSQSQLWGPEDEDDPQG